MTCKMTQCVKSVYFPFTNSFISVASTVYYTERTLRKWNASVKKQSWMAALCMTALKIDQKAKLTKLTV